MPAPVRLPYVWGRWSQGRAWDPVRQRGRYRPSRTPTIPRNQGSVKARCQICDSPLPSPSALVSPRQPLRLNDLAVLEGQTALPQVCISPCRSSGLSPAQLPVRERTDGRISLGRGAEPKLKEARFQEHVIAYREYRHLRAGGQAW